MNHAERLAQTIRNAYDSRSRDDLEHALRRMVDTMTYTGPVETPQSVDAGEAVDPLPEAKGAPSAPGKPVYGMLHCGRVSVEARNRIVARLAPDHWELRDWGEVIAMRWDDSSRAPKDFAARDGEETVTLRLAQHGTLAEPAKAPQQGISRQAEENHGKGCKRALGPCQCDGKAAKATCMHSIKP